MCCTAVRCFMSKRQSADPNKQYRHFVITMNVHPTTGEPFADPMESDANSDVLFTQINDAIRILYSTVGSRNHGYQIVQLEKGKKSEDKTKESKSNGLHLQCYFESKQSIRLRTMWRYLPYAHVRPRKGLRDTAREYCMPNKGSPFNLFDETYLAGPFEIGHWRPSRSDESTDDPFESAVRLALKGYTAKYIARQFPKVWVRRGAGLAHLINTLNAGDQFVQDYEE